MMESGIEIRMVGGVGRRPRRDLSASGGRRRGGLRKGSRTREALSGW